MVKIQLGGAICSQQVRQHRVATSEISLSYIHVFNAVLTSLACWLIFESVLRLIRMKGSTQQISIKLVEFSCASIAAVRLRMCMPSHGLTSMRVSCTLGSHHLFGFTQSDLKYLHSTISFVLCCYSSLWCMQSIHAIALCASAAL